MSDDQEREHAASGRRRAEFASRNQVARSRDFSGALVLAFGTWWLVTRGGQIAARVINVTRILAGNIDHPLDASLLYLFGTAFCGIVLPVACMAGLGALAAALIQAHGVLPFNPPGIDFSRLNPTSKIMQMFAFKESLITLLQLIIKVAVLGTILYLAAKDPLTVFVSQVPTSLGAALGQAGAIFLRILKRGLFASILFGIIDYAWQWWRLEQRMKMSTTEVKEEAKDQQGDGNVKSRRRKMAREILQRRSLKAVPKADVVITNPTHVAVALRYDDANMAAPTVVAKGGDRQAEEIRAVARRHGVPIVPQPPLARLLYAQVKVGKAIPAEVYQAVAVILAHCYRLKKRSS